MNSSLLIVLAVLAAVAHCKIDESCATKALQCEKEAAPECEKLHWNHKDGEKLHKELKKVHECVKEGLKKGEADTEGEEILKEAAELFKKVHGGSKHANGTKHDAKKHKEEKPKEEKHKDKKNKDEKHKDNKNKDEKHKDEKNKDKKHKEKKHKHSTVPKTEAEKEAEEKLEKEEKEAKEKCEKAVQVCFNDFTEECVTKPNAKAGALLARCAKEAGW